MTSGKTRHIFSTNAARQRLADALEQGRVAAMALTGHRLGLFEAMTSNTAWFANDLAQHVGLNQSYVESWLDAMAYAGFLHYDANRDRYLLLEALEETLTGPEAAKTFGAFSVFTENQAWPLSAAVLPNVASESSNITAAA